MLKSNGPRMCVAWGFGPPLPERTRRLYRQHVTCLILLDPYI